MKGSEIMWRKANNDERRIIMKKYMPKEIISALMVTLLDAIVIGFVLMSLPRDFKEISFGYAIVAIPITLFLAYILFYTVRSVFKSVKSAYLIASNKYEVTDCKLEDVSVNRIGWINNANVTAKTSDGESYRTSYGSAFTTSVSNGQSALLMLLGKETELVLR